MNYHLTFSRVFGIVIFALCGIFAPIVFSAESSSPADLQKAIQEKSQALQEVNQKILQAQTELMQTEQKSKSLQQEIGSFDKNISRLNLTIRSGELTVDKLGLEIQSLQGGIQDTEVRMSLKKAAVAELLRLLQRKDDENVLAALLKSQSLTESLSEAQTILDLNSGLAR